MNTNSLLLGATGAAALCVSVATSAAGLLGTEALNRMVVDSMVANPGRSITKNWQAMVDEKQCQKPPPGAAPGDPDPFPLCNGKNADPTKVTGRDPS